MTDVLELKKSKVDFINLIQSNFKFAESKFFYTLNIDLQKDIKTIWQNINKNYRYEIRRAENKDKLFEKIICNPSKKASLHPNCPSVVDLSQSFSNSLASIRT